MGVQFLKEQLPAGFRGVRLAALDGGCDVRQRGGLFADRGTIIDLRTLERLLSRCDGDTLYVLKVLKVLKEFPDWADNSFE